MIPVATLNAIRDTLHAQPFRPFDIKLVDGQSYRVPHPEHVFIPPLPRPREIMYFELLDDGDDWRTRWIDINLVCEVTIPTDAPPRARADEQS
jgi:hypothetical protein